MGLDPFALAWIYDQLACRFTLLVLAMPSAEGVTDRVGDYHAAVQAVLARDRDAPGGLLAIDDRHPGGTTLRRAITLLRQPQAPQALNIGNFILLPSWVYHVQDVRRTVPPKWRRERV